MLRAVERKFEPGKNYVIKRCSERKLFCKPGPGMKIIRVWDENYADSMSELLFTDISTPGPKESALPPPS